MLLNDTKYMRYTNGSQTFLPHGALLSKKFSVVDKIDLSSRVPENFLAGEKKFKTKAPFFCQIEQVVVKFLKLNRKFNFQSIVEDIAVPAQKTLGGNTFLSEFYRQLPES